MIGFVATLSNGQILKENLIYNTLFFEDKTLRPWKLLKKYIKLNKLKLVSLHLEYGHQGIYLPNNAKAYFYSHKVESFLGGNSKPQKYIGIGATETHNDKVIITWFDGESSKLEKRKVVDNDQFIINE